VSSAWFSGVARNGFSGESIRARLGDDRAFGVTKKGLSGEPLRARLVATFSPLSLSQLSLESLDFPLARFR